MSAYQQAGSSDLVLLYELVAQWTFESEAFKPGVSAEDFSIWLLQYF